MKLLIMDFSVGYKLLGRNMRRLEDNVQIDFAGTECIYN
jgi:hypothetical protein